MHSVIQSHKTRSKDVRSINQVTPNFAGLIYRSPENPYLMGVLVSGRSNTMQYKKHNVWCVRVYINDGNNK